MHDIKVFLFGLLVGFFGTVIGAYFVIRNNKKKAQEELERVKPN